jgi:uncharacterized membrane protein YfcA
MSALLEPSVLLTLALASVVGVTLGLLGGGGSIMMVPILVYVTGLETKEAIASSLVVVGVTSAVASIGHARAGRVRWRTGLLFGTFGLGGAFLGGLLGGRLPSVVLMVLFALMMVATSVAMIRGRSAPAKAAHTELPVVRVMVDGLVVGVVTGLVGAGGGFLVVPALALLGGLPMSVAVGTSLLVIAMKSLGGVAGYLSAVTLDWPLVATVTAVAVAGSFVGARLVGRMPEDTLRRGFGWFVLAMGAFVLGRQLPSEALLPALVGVGVIAVLGVVCWRLGERCPLRRARAGRHETDAEVPARS